MTGKTWEGKKLKLWGDDKCPACNQDEDDLNFTKCTHSKMELERFKQVQIFCKTMKKMNTYPGIITSNELMASGEWGTNNKKFWLSYVT